MCAIMFRFQCVNGHILLSCSTRQFYGTIVWIFDKTHVSVEHQYHAVVDLFAADNLIGSHMRYAFSWEFHSSSINASSLSNCYIVYYHALSPVMLFG